MSPRTRPDVEDLLRHTYAELAARTQIDPTAPLGDARVVPIEDRSRRPVVRALAWAAAVVVPVVGGLVLLTGRDVEAPAATGPLVHVVPGHPPTVPAAGDGIAGRGPAEDELVRLPLTSVTSDPALDELVYATDDVVLTYRAFRPDLPDQPPFGSLVPVRGDRTAILRSDDAQGLSLSWEESPDLAVEIRLHGSGALADTLVALADGLVVVDEPTWERATAHAGFTAPGERPLLTRRIDADRPFDVDVDGDLHDGFLLELGPNGFGLPVDGCRAAINELTTDAEEGRTGYVVLVPGRATSATVRMAGEPDRSVALTPLTPDVDVSVGGIVLDRPVGSDPPEVSCDGGEG